MKLQNLIRQFGVLLLFSGIFYGVFIGLSGNTLSDARAWGNHHAANIGEKSETFEENQVTLKEKALKEEKEPEQHISSEKIDEPESLEEVMNMKQYPRATVTATGYTAGAESTGKDSSHPEYGITFSGVEVKRDLYSTIAADLDVYPIGTIMYIPDYGYGVVADKGSAINGDQIDLYYPTVEDVYEEWGKKEVEVYIVEMGDGTLSEKQFKKWNENEALQVFREQINDN